MSEVIDPGAVLGVFGGGQLGRMFAIAARRMGYRVHVYSPEDDTPTGQVADVETKGDYRDLNGVARFAGRIAALTFEFENIPIEAIEVAARHTRVRPAGSVLHTTQHRLREKRYLRRAGIPVTPYVAVHSRQDLDAAIAHSGYPAVLKTAAWGYDGKGQWRITNAVELAAAWAGLGGQEGILESYIDLEREVSVIGVRGAAGHYAHYGPLENRHRQHILDVSIAPASLEPRVAAEACDIARAVLEALDVIGVLCVEMFLARDGRLMVNELAPRPHNSGHLTIDAYTCCQFEQQVRAVCGLPLGAATLLRPAAMANLLGELWQAGTPDWCAACAYPDLSLHLYGKNEPRPGRKMGHLTACAETRELALERVLAARAALTAEADRARDAMSSAIRKG